MRVCHSKSKVEFIAIFISVLICLALFMPKNAYSAPVTVIHVDLRYEYLQLFLKDANGVPFKKFKRLAANLKRKNKTLVFAMNAGMYHSDFSPVGLFVSEGKTFAPLNTRRGEGNFFMQPNGVFAVTRDGARIVETSAFSSIASQTVLATQSGPILLQNGKINKAFSATSRSRTIRNGVCVFNQNKLAFVISDVDMSLFEFANFFKEKLACQNALYFDGFISSLYSQQLQRDDEQYDLGPIIAVIR